MLQTEVSDLRTPAEEERGEGQHGGDVSHSYVADVDTSKHDIITTLIRSDNISSEEKDKTSSSGTMYSCGDLSRVSSSR